MTFVCCVHSRVLGQRQRCSRVFREDRSNCEWFVRIAGAKLVEPQKRFLVGRTASLNSGTFFSPAVYLCVCRSYVEDAITGKHRSTWNVVIFRRYQRVFRCGDITSRHFIGMVFRWFFDINLRAKRIARV